MKIYMSNNRWLKIAALCTIAMGTAACSSFAPDTDDVYEPIAHYERHPIIVTRSGAYAEDCGNWPSDLSDTWRNKQYENLGCAQQNNIAAMVADKDDLWRPRKQAPSDAMRRSKLFDKYRQGEATAAAQETKQKVVISDVGAGG